MRGQSDNRLWSSIDPLDDDFAAPPGSAMSGIGGALPPGSGAAAFKDEL